MNMVDFSILLRGDYPKLIANGLITMVELTLAAWVLAMIVGTLLTLARMTSSRTAGFLVAAWVEFHQNVPMLVQIFLWYFGISTLLPQEAQIWLNRHNGEFAFAVLSIGLALSAYISEDLRGGIRAIPKSQLEASRALGLSYLQAFRLVVFPQAFRYALPTVVSHTVLLFKGTALAMTIGVAELTYVTREIESETFKTVEVYLFTSLVYLAISLVIMAFGAMAERRLAFPTR